MIQPREARLFNVSDVRVSTVDKHTNEGEQAVRLCNYVDVYKNEVILNDFDFMPATCTPDEIARFRLAPGDIVFTKDSETADDIGIPAFVETSAPDLVCGYHVAIATPHQNLVDPKFLFWYLNSRPAFAWWETRASGVTRVGLRQEDIRHLPLGALPPMSHQRAIADFLDRETAQIDAMIQAQQEVVERLEERAHASASHQLIGRWLDLEPVHLSRVLTKLARPPRDEDGVVTAYRDGQVTLRGDRRSEGYTFSDKEQGYQGVEIGDLVFHALDGFAGAVGLSDAGGKSSPVYHVCKVDGAHNPTFVALLLRALGHAGFLTAYAWSVRQRSVDFRNWSLFAQLPLRMPPRSLQDEIAEEVVESGKHQAVAAIQSGRVIELLRERRDALITAAVTGRIDPDTGIERIDRTTEKEAL